ncbi:hypothetical protein [Streptomyces sp. NPDC006463]|uniref:hypothetical protein n=1 Tax=Streptomyces sp. NPDC006463 TaxID=3364746 RepID=UPI0036A95677
MSSTLPGQEPAGPVSDRYQQEIARLRRDRAVPLTVFGVIIAAGSTAFVRVAPHWANPLAVGIAAATLYLAVVGLYVRWSPVTPCAATCGARSTGAAGSR